jgi:ribosomal protein S12 methylthiotransferase accessory factor
MCFSPTQYAEPDPQNDRARSFRVRIPEPLDPREPVDWSPVWSLTTNRERLVPTALCYFGAFVPGLRYCVADSNGNSAGNTIDEAILHGLLELIERDHVALWWYNKLRAPAVDLENIGDPWLARLRAYSASQGCVMWALDLTADLGVPVVAAITTVGDGSRFVVGMGAHLTLHGATVRAATELLQVGGAEPRRLHRTRSVQILDLERHPFVRPDPDRDMISCDDTLECGGDVTDALSVCRDAIERQSLEILVLDLTRPDIGMPVVKVFAPGLRHFWPRFGPGRLYDVPLSLGWLDRPRAERDFDLTPPAV